jgi:molybdenum cofactor biosynthesis enzyme MoaA
VCTLYDKIHTLEVLSELGIKSVKFTGGEPLISDDFVAALQTAAKLEMDITVVTNGTLLDKNIARLLKRFMCKVKISLHGEGLLHNWWQQSDTYDDVLQGIHVCLEEGLHTSIHTLLHPNLNTEKWICHLINLGISKVTFIPLIPRGRACDMKDGYLFQYGIDSQKGKLRALSMPYQHLIDIRYLDLWNKPYLSFESDKGLLWELYADHCDVDISYLIEQCRRN